MTVFEEISSIYNNNKYRDLDEKSWRGTTGIGNFKNLKSTLRRNHPVENMLKNFRKYTDLSCEFNIPIQEHMKRYYRDALRLEEYIHEEDVIVEIGAGGAAGTALKFLSRNKIKCYVICDLSTVLLVSYYNLTTSFPELKIHYLRPEEKLEVVYNDYDVVLVPQYDADKLRKISVKLFYNAYSLSEMCESEIAEYMDIIQSTGQYFISENYLGPKEGKCHICDGPYLALKEFIPDNLKIVKQEDSISPGNGYEARPVIHYMI